MKQVFKKVEYGEIKYFRKLTSIMKLTIVLQEILGIIKINEVL